MEQRLGMKLGTATLACLLLAGLWSCGQAQGSNSPSSRQLVQEKESPVVVAKRPKVVTNPRLVTAQTRFGLQLFSQLVQSQPNQNVVISPTSVALALAMTYNGAQGETQTAMAKTLELQGMSLPELNQANADLAAALKNPDAGVRLTIANSLWARQGIEFQPEFLQRNQTFYGAQVSNLDFGNPSAVGTINRWVQQNTQGKIPQIVDRLNRDQVLFLINAIYFKGQWKRPFDKAQTKEQPFYRADGTQKSHPLMSQQGNYAYYENEQFQAVALPYGQGGKLSFYVFLPRQTSNLNQFYQKLTPENWQTWLQQFRRREGTVQIPRFKLEYGTDLKQPLSALGMAPAFDLQKANFSGMGQMPMAIDQVKHKTVIEVNEEGTEAAAVTSVGIVATSMPVGEPFQFTADRPFFCAIRDNQTGTVLFMGAIGNP